MKKSDLIPMKHLLVTRDKNVYWYIGNDMQPEDNVVACGTTIDRDLDKTWDINLIARRDGSLDSYIEPRDYDVIYVYEITDVNEWFKIFHENKFIEFKTHLKQRYSFKSFVKQIYERIDGSFD